MQEIVARILEDARLVNEVTVDDMVTGYKKVQMLLERLSAHVIARRFDSPSDVRMDAAIAACVEGICRFSEHCLDDGEISAVFERFGDLERVREILPEGWGADSIEPDDECEGAPIRVIARVQYLEGGGDCDCEGLLDVFASKTLELPTPLARYLAR